jgi:outer membrane protein assembly factor BamD
MISAYDLLNLDDLKKDTIRILQTNYPNSAMLSKTAPKEERVWWKFWEGLY